MAKRKRTIWQITTQKTEAQPPRTPLKSTTCGIRRVTLVITSYKSWSILPRFGLYYRGNCRKRREEETAYPSGAPEYNIVLLRNDFHIGLVIGPRSAILAFGAYWPSHRSEACCIGLRRSIQSKFKKNNKTTLLNETNCRISELEILRVKYC
jgi:hypothetical protein